MARYGINKVSQRGSHRKWRHAAHALVVIVPEHGGRELPIGTLHNIMRNAEIPAYEWQD